jgi:hypothetical protein
VRAIDPTLLVSVCGGVRLPGWCKVSGKQVLEGVFAGIPVAVLFHYLNKVRPPHPPPPAPHRQS